MIGTNILELAVIAMYLTDIPHYHCDSVRVLESYFQEWYICAFVLQADYFIHVNIRKDLPQCVTSQAV